MPSIAGGPWRDAAVLYDAKVSSGGVQMSPWSQVLMKVPCRVCITGHNPQVQ